MKGLAASEPPNGNVGKETIQALAAPNLKLTVCRVPKEYRPKTLKERKVTTKLPKIISV